MPWIVVQIPNLIKQLPMHFRILCPDLGCIHKRSKGGDRIPAIGYLLIFHGYNLQPKSQLSGNGLISLDLGLQSIN